MKQALWLFLNGFQQFTSIFVFSAPFSLVKDDGPRVMALTCMALEHIFFSLVSHPVSPVPSCLLFCLTDALFFSTTARTYSQLWFYAMRNKKKKTGWWYPWNNRQAFCWECSLKEMLQLLSSPSYWCRWQLCHLSCIAVADHTCFSWRALHLMLFSFPAPQRGLRGQLSHVTTNVLCDALYLFKLFCHEGTLFLTCCFHSVHVSECVRVTASREIMRFKEIFGKHNNCLMPPMCCKADTGVEQNCP